MMKGPMIIYLPFYAPEETSGGILKSHLQSIHNKSCLNDNMKTVLANLMKLHRKIKHNEKVGRAQELSTRPRSLSERRSKCALNRVSAII